MAVYTGQELVNKLNIEFQKIQSEIDTNITYNEPRLSVFITSDLVNNSEFTEKTYTMNYSKTL